MEESKGPSAEEFRDWLPARDVSARLRATLGTTEGRAAIWDRLCVGLVRAAAGHEAVAQSRAEQGPVWVARNTWKAVKGIVVEDLWQTGQLTVWLYLSGRSESTRFNFYDVRFEPSGIDKMLPPAEKPASALNPAVALKYERKTHVTEGQMKAWYAAFKAAYGGGPRDTLPFGWDSALGFFPDKEVSRDDVRKAMAADGPRDRGPKRPK
jgi:hypothetical protein